MTCGRQTHGEDTTPALAHDPGSGDWSSGLSAPTQKGQGVQNSPHAAQLRGLRGGRPAVPSNQSTRPGPCSPASQCLLLGGTIALTCRDAEVCSWQHHLLEPEIWDKTETPSAGTLGPSSPWNAICHRQEQQGDFLCTDLAEVLKCQW